MAKATKDKRAHDRFNHCTPIRYRRSTQAGDYQKAEMQNCSEGGMYFESDAALNPGETVHITCTNTYEGCQATVQWCRRHAPDSKHSKRFGIGVAYCDPEDEAL